MLKKISLILFSLICFFLESFSQVNSDYINSTILEKNTKYIFEFRDGTISVGTFQKEESGNVYIIDINNKEIYIPLVMIAQAHIVTEKNLVGDEYIFPNLHSSRYFFSPTAFALDKREGYYNNIYWLLWQFQYGLTNNFSIGGGTSILGLPTTLNAKISFPGNDKITFASGFFWIGSLFWNDDIGTLVSMPYCVVTIGSEENNFTFGLGYNLSDGFVDYNNHDTSPSDRLTLNFGGTLRASRRFSIIGEGWLFNSNSDPLFMGGPGIRYFRKINRVTSKNGSGAKTFDFQLLISPDFEGAIPLFGASQKF